MGRRSLKKRRKSSMENTNRDQFLLISAEKIAGNEDLLSEILLRLPVRSLVRFKCVSKPWLRLISSSHFSHTHTTRNFRSLSVSGFIFSNGTCKFKFVGLDGARSEFAPSPELMVKSDVYIVHSCNGLMLCYSVPENEFYPRDYFVCNPTTKEFSSISLPHSLYDLGINLVYDPFGSPHFKVVCFTGVIDPHNRISPEPITYWTHLYSSDSQSWSSRSWSSLESPGRAFLCSADDAPLSNGVLCNGSLYWLFANQWMLLRFEVDRQCFSTIAMKVDSNLIDTRGIGDSIYLWQCKGRLCLVQEAVTFNVPADMVVYEMGNVCSQWLVKYMVKFPDEVSGLDAHENVEDGEVCTYTILAAFGGQENDYVDDTRLLVRLEYNFREPDVILYSIKEKTATKMMFSGFEEEAQPYMESLSPLSKANRML